MAKFRLRQRSSEECRLLPLYPNAVTFFPGAEITVRFRRDATKADELAGLLDEMEGLLVVPFHTGLLKLRFHKKKLLLNLPWQIYCREQLVGGVLISQRHA